jgi:hypothetical protein
MMPVLDFTHLDGDLYDCPRKGNGLVIEVGKDEVTYAHTINAPTKVLTGQISSSKIAALWIGDAAGTKPSIQPQLS